MQVVQNSTEGLKREYTITVPAADIEAKVSEKLKTLSQEVRMKGFRPGKVPVALLRKMYGKSVLGEVLEETVSTSSQDALKQDDVTPAVQPKIEVQSFDEGTDLQYTLAVEVMPQIEPMDFAGLELEREVAEIDDARLEEQLATIAQQQKSFETLAEPRPAASGDAAVIDFEGRIDGVVFDGGTGSDVQLELGAGRFIPGFEEQLIGAGAGDAVTVTTTFPDNYGNADLAGKEAEFAVTVKEIKAAKTVAVDDELAKLLGLDDLPALRDAVRQQMERDLTGLSRMRLKRKLLDALAEKHLFDVPPSMVDQEFAQIWRQLGHEVAEDHGHDHDHDHEHDHVHDHGPAEPAEAAPPAADSLPAPDDDAPDDDGSHDREEYRGIAERRVRLGLLLSEVGRRNQIEVGPDEINRAMMEQARRYPGQEREVVEFMRDNPEAAASVRAPIFEDKVIDFILEMATVKNRTISFDELTRDPDDEGEGEGEAEGDGDAAETASQAP